MYITRSAAVFEKHQLTEIEIEYIHSLQREQDKNHVEPG